MHWGYGTTWGILYTLVRGTKEHSIVREGIAFVWSASYLQLVPMGIYRPPWKYDARTRRTTSPTTLRSASV